MPQLNEGADEPNKPNPPSKPRQVDVQSLAITEANIAANIAQRVDPQVLSEALDNSKKAVARQEANVRARVDVQPLSEAIQTHAAIGGLAARLDISATRTNEMFKWIDPVTLQQAPFTTAHYTSADQNEATMAAFNDTTVWYAQIYGNDSMGAFAALHMISDPTSLQRTRDLLMDITGLQPAAFTTPGPGYRGNPSTAPVPDAVNQTNFESLVSDPTALQENFSRMTPAEQRGVISYASALKDAFGKAPSSAVIDEFNRTVLVARDGYQVVLSKPELDTLDQLMAMASSGVGGTTRNINELGVQMVNGVPTPVGAQGRLSTDAQALGIAQLQHVQGGVLVLDTAWAQANPSEALGIKEYLEARYPDSRVTIGPQGIIGSFINHLGMPIDYITAPIGAAVHQFSEALQAVTADGDPKKTLAAVDMAEASVNAAGVVPKWVRDLFAQASWLGDVNNPDDVQQLFDHMREQNTFEVNHQTIWQDLKDNTRPEQMGFGLGDTFTRSVGLLPGDPTYEGTRIAIGLVAQVVLDPLNYAGPVIGGVRAASRIPLLEATDEAIQALRATGRYSEATLGAMEASGVIGKQITNSWIKQFVYMKLARTPDEFVLTNTYINTVNSLWSARVAAGSPGAFATALVTNAGMDIERARALARATSEADMSIALLSDSLGMGATSVLDDVFDVTAERNALSDTIAHTDVTDPAFHDLVAQRQFYDSVIKGSDATKPFDAMPTYRQLSRLQHAVGSPPTGVERAILAAEDTVRRFPSSMIPRTSLSLRKFETAQADVDAAKAALREAEVAHDSSAIRTAKTALAHAERNIAYQARKSIVRSFGEFRNIWRPAGFGGRWVPEDILGESSFTGIRKATADLATATEAGDKEAIKIAERALAKAESNMTGAVSRGLTDVRDAARMLGIEDRRFRQLVAPFVSGTMTNDLPAQYKWFKETWRALIDESPKLSGLAKKQLRDLYDVAVHDRVGSMLTNADGLPVGVLTRQIPGQLKPYVIPSISADMVRSVPLPSLRDFRDVATNVGRTKTYWETLGDPRRAISLTHGYLAKLWQQGNSIWRTSVLGSRLAFALPLRIIAEQQLRMAGFEYDSMVWHPLEWFRSTNWHPSWFDTPSDIWAAAGSPEHALGSMIDNISPQWQNLGRNMVSIDDGDPFFHSFSGELAKYYRSPEVRQWRIVDGHIMSPDQYLELLRATPQKGEAWLRHLRLTIKSGQSEEDALRVAAENLTRDMEQLVGTGEGADYIKTALALGHVTVDDKDYIAGTYEFGAMLRRLVEEDRWMPGKTDLPREAMSALRGDPMHPLANARDWLFNMFYSRPDLATSRVPLYHQVWEREFQNLMSVGYSEARATEVARATAAHATADMMFQIGAHTSGEMFLRTIMPFFPAYRELGTVWAYRLPVRIGQLREARMAALGWGLGATVLAHRASVIMQGLEQMGIVQTDARGRLSVPVPFLGGLINWATGANAEWDTNISLESMVGILPVPFGLFETDENGDLLPWNERLRGALPTLGGMSVATMALLKSKLPNIIGPLEDWSTMFGSDTSFGPHSLDMIWQVTHQGDAPPWVFGRTADLQEATYQFAIDDGMRLAMNEIPAPVWHPGMTYDQQKVFDQATADYLTQIVNRGHRYATGIYFLKSVVGSVLPFSISMTDEVKSEYGHMWEVLNAMPGGPEGDLARSMYTSMLQANPEMGVYAVPKALDMRDVDSPDRSMEAYVQGIADGKLKVRGDREWALFAWGSNSRALHYATLSRIRRESGDTIAERMMNRDANDALDAENQKWKTFLTWSKQSTQELGYPQSLDDMFGVYDDYRKARGNEPQITTEQQMLIDFDQSMRQYSQYFDYNYETAGTYFKAKKQAYAALYANPSTNPEINAKQWYFKMADAYYHRRDKLYKSLETAVGSAASLAIYTHIRRLDDKYNKALVNPEHPEWGTFPSPEEYSWSQKTVQDQRRLVAKWSTQPVEWLTEFQRTQAGYDIPDDKQNAVTQWVNYSAQQEQFRLEAERAAGIHTNTLQYDADKALEAQRIAAKAKELGVTDIVGQFDAVPYVRVGEALNLQSNPGWQRAVQERGFAMQYLQVAKIDPQGESAQPTRELFGKRVERFRNTDAGLDHALDEIALALDKPNHQDLYDYLFFNKVF